MASEPATDETGGMVSIVVPTYHEAENLRLLVPRLADVMTEAALPYEIIIVDDDSRDGSEDVIAEFARGGQPVRIITRVGERGLSSAVIRGFRESRGDILVCMDADLSHPPEAVPRLVAALREPGAEFVIGSRYVAGGGTEQGWGLFRWLNSKVATLMARPFTRAKDPMAGFFCLYRARFEAAEKLSPIGYKIGLELIVKCRCRNIREVPIHFADRKLGQSKLSLKEQVNYLKHLKRLADFKYGAFSQFMQFCLVGVTGMAVDLGVLKLLMETGTIATSDAELKFKISRALAIWVAMTWNFAFNRRLTFSHSRRGSILPQYLRFVLSCSVGAVASWGTAVGLKEGVPFFAAHLYLAAVIGIIVGTILNFVLSKFWVFRRPDAEQSGAPPAVGGTGN